jgi:hypothetical protein
MRELKKKLFGGRLIKVGFSTPKVCFSRIGSQTPGDPRSLATNLGGGEEPTSSMTAISLLTFSVASGSRDNQSVNVLKTAQEFLFADVCLAQHSLRYEVIELDAIVADQGNPIRFFRVP